MKRLLLVLFVIVSLTAGLVVVTADRAKAEGPFDCSMNPKPWEKPCVDPTCFYSAKQKHNRDALNVGSWIEISCAGHNHKDAKGTIIAQEELNVVDKRKLGGCDRCLPDCDWCAKDYFVRVSIKEGTWKRGIPSMKHRLVFDQEVVTITSCKNTDRTRHRAVGYIYSRHIRFPKVPMAVGKDRSKTITIPCRTLPTKFV